MDWVAIGLSLRLAAIVAGILLVIALPVAAIFLSSLTNLELPRGMTAAIGIIGSMIAGIATVDAVLQAHW